MMEVVTRVTHVIVDNPDATAAASLKIATWALGVAVATFLAVLAQIWISNRQIRLAKDQLKVASEELEAVNADFALAQEQFKEITRRPQLTVGVGIQKPWVGNPAAFQAFFNLRNNGDKLTRSLLLELLVPAADFESEHGGVSGLRSGAIAINDVTYAVFGVTIEYAIYPNGVILDVPFPVMRMHATVEKSTLYFRAYDENFAYPYGGYGLVQFLQSGPSSMVSYMPKGGVAAPAPSER